MFLPLVYMLKFWVKWNKLFMRLHNIIFSDVSGLLTTFQIHFVPNKWYFVSTEQNENSSKLWADQVLDFTPTVLLLVKLDHLLLRHHPQQLGGNPHLWQVISITDNIIFIIIIATLLINIIIPTMSTFFKSPSFPFLRASSPLVTRVPTLRLMLMLILTDKASLSTSPCC